MCSTPFGITDYFGLRAVASAAICVRGCSTPFGITDYFGRAGARAGRDRHDVLNAFRHHGLFRPSWRTTIVRLTFRVLNAFRHHGLFRSSEGSRARDLIQCSTPFGITDYFGVRDPAVVRGGLQCSTPFGITDYFGSATVMPSSSRFCAQRLSASRIISAGCGNGRVDRSEVVLNAFRHHGLFRTGSGISSTNKSTGAQRLSASRIISDRERNLVHEQINRCSTPFGITDYFGRSRRPPTRRQVISAQRLSASRIISAGGRRGCRGRAAVVLNAFRHHGLFRQRPRHAGLAER